MKRVLLTVAVAAIATPIATAQVYVRAPFVRVQVGPGVAVQAPGVDVLVPPAGPVYVVPLNEPTTNVELLFGSPTKRPLTELPVMMVKTSFEPGA